jgi:signal transduction histidine kinase
MGRGKQYLNWKAIDSGKTQLVKPGDGDRPPEVPLSEEARKLLELTRIHSAIGVPLVARGRTLGALLVGMAKPSPGLDAGDIPLAEGLAQRAALALDNARLYAAAQSALRARDHVLGVVAHDLRTPLGNILLQAATLHRHAEVDADRTRGEVIERQAWRMHRLIQDLLDITRLEAGELSMHRTAVNAAELIEDVLENQLLLASSATLELRAEVPANTPEVAADRDRLMQVFENLVGNAIKFTPPGGRVVIGATPGEKEVTFWVSDTGAGIQAMDLPHIFQRFWQASKGEHRGAGLGLPIVNGVVEAHGGRVWVESTPGKGSTFFFTLPTAAVGLVPQPRSPQA